MAMSLPALLEQRLRLPVVAAPMFLISNPQLVLACCRNGVGRRVIQCGEARFDFFQPGLEPAAFALVKRRETPDHPVAAARQDQLRVGNQEHRRRHDGQRRRR